MLQHQDTDQPYFVCTVHMSIPSTRIFSPIFYCGAVWACWYNLVNNCFNNLTQGWWTEKRKNQVLHCTQWKK